MANSSPSVQVKQIETQVSMILRRIDPQKLETKPRAALANLRQALGDARIYACDYEFSEMRDEQLANAKKAKKYLVQAHQNILKASEFDIFGAADVAQLSAQIDQIIGGLK
ncbi:MAG: hypothetical protein ACREGG_04200 [Candidatus Saccharimonadales bacterium]